MKHTQATKRKLSLMRRGEKNPFFGRKHTDEAKQRMANATRKRNLERGTYKPQPLTVNLPMPVDAAYLAGIIDGEGSIHMIRGRPRITIYNNSRPLMTWIEKTIGGRAKITDRRGRVPGYSWTLYSARNVWALLYTIERHLIIKSAGARNAIEFFGRKYGWGHEELKD